MLYKHVWWYVRSRIGNEKGQGLVEYGLILALVGVAVAVALSTLGTDINTLLGTVHNKLSSTSTAPATTE